MAFSIALVILLKQLICGYLFTSLNSKSLPIVLKSIYIGRFRLSTTLVQSRIRACFLQMFEKVILLNTGSHFKEIDFNILPIILIAELSLESNFLVCALLIQLYIIFSSNSQHTLSKDIGQQSFISFFGLPSFNTVNILVCLKNFYSFSQ